METTITFAALFFSLPIAFIFMQIILNPLKSYSRIQKLFASLTFAILVWTLNSVIFLNLGN